jgi:hypothetical protein
MGGIQSNSLMNFSSFERLRDDLLFNLVACFSPLLPPPTSISNKHKKIPLQNKLLEVFQLYDEVRVL